jgi:metal-responsive CopG/Arc/MetJ family transcriptional regulator
MTKDRTSVSMPEQMADAVETAAKSEGRSVASFIRVAVRDRLKEQHGIEVSA